MPRPIPPPTPSSSTDLAALEKTYRDADMEGSFALPPPAVHSQVKPVVTGSKSNSTPPTSPRHKPQPSSPRHKRTLSGAPKSKEESNPASNFNLPPPPSRARKIIQMKPKSASAASTSPSETSSHPAAAAQNSKSPSTKRKQPSATSAAGRKIARKTAHSIIERRRRSKMNEEFGVLKDMIPACEGVEMHKLAILQAGIEYVRYLEGCIAQLKGDKRSQRSPEAMQWRRGKDEEEDEDNEDEDEDEDEYESPPKRSATTSTTGWQSRSQPMAPASTSSSHASPDLAPMSSSSRTSSSRAQAQRTVLPSIPSFTTNSPTGFMAHSISATPTPTLLSPAFNAIHFSPDLARTATASSAATSLSVGPSPNILPLPQALMSLNNRESNKSPAALSEGGMAEATATAALMMLTNDRRGASGDENSGRGKGMSVHDLLSS